MHRVLIAASLGLLALLLLVAPVAAGRNWCYRDPIVTLNGEPVQIWFAIEDQYEQLVTGPIEVKIFVPHKVESELVYLDQGFNGHGENVRFARLDGAKVAKNGSFPVEISAWFPVDKQALKEMGIHSQNIPFRIVIEVGGELIPLAVTADGTVIPPDVVNAASFEVEQTNDHTKIAFVVSPGQ